MKKFLAVVVVVAIALVGANAAFALIAGSKHDMSSATYYSGGALSSCAYCHTPHKADTTIAGAPLWNRTVGASYTTYGTTLGGSTIAAVNGNSKTCLSCHDGTIAVGATLNNGTDPATGATLNAGVITSNVYGNRTNLTTDLRDDHPVGVVYNSLVAGLADPGLLSGANPTFTAGATTFKLYGSASYTLECATCHDPHDTTNAAFLRGPESSICSDCHSGK